VAGVDVELVPEAGAAEQEAVGRAIDLTAEASFSRAIVSSNASLQLL